MTIESVRQCYPQKTSVYTFRFLVETTVQSLKVENKPIAFPSSSKGLQEGVVLIGPARRQVRKHEHKESSVALLARGGGGGVGGRSLFVNDKFRTSILTHQGWSVLMDVTLYSAWYHIYRWRLQAAFSEGLWQLSHNLAVNWDSTEMNAATNYRGSTHYCHHFVIISTRTALFTCAVNKGSTPGIASGWRGVLTKLWTLSETTAPEPTLCVQQIFK